MPVIVEILTNVGWFYLKIWNTWHFRYCVWCLWERNREKLLGINLDYELEKEQKFCWDGRILFLNAHCNLQSLKEKGIQSIYLIWCPKPKIICHIRCRKVYIVRSLFMYEKHVEMIVCRSTTVIIVKWVSNVWNSYSLQNTISSSSILKRSTYS